MLKELKKYRRVKWFNQERINNWLWFDVLRTIHFCLLFSNKVYNFVNRHQIKQFADTYSEYTPTKSEKKVLDQLKADGIAFADISDFFETNMLDQLKNRFDRLSSLRGDAYMKDPSSYLKILDLNGDICDDDTINEWVMCRSFINIASLYLELVPRCSTKQEYIVIPSSNPKTGAQLWHRDGSDKKIVKIFVYLNDVNEKNGPFRYLKGSHYKGVLRDIAAWTSAHVWERQERMDSNLEFYDELFEGRETVCTGKAGTVIFADTSGFHRGGFCIEGSRSMIELSFATEAAFISHGPYKIPTSYSFPQDPVLKRAFGLL